MVHIISRPGSAILSSFSPPSNDAHFRLFDSRDTAMWIHSRLAFLSTLVFCPRVKAFQSPSWTRGLTTTIVSRGTAVNGETVNGDATVFNVDDTFTSQPMKVFIEDTDAYGVVYNGNYIKFYDRALQHAQSSSAHGFPDDVIVAVGNQKFRSSPSLGDEFFIEGVLKEIDEAERQIWDLSLKSLDGAILYHTAEQVMVASPKNARWLSEEDQFTNNLPCSTDSFTAYRDEFDASVPSHLPLKSVLKHFERPRTNLFGGPKELRRAQEEDGIIFVVSRISDLCLLDHRKDSLVGDALTVKTSCDIRKGGMRTDFLQTIYTRSGERLAQGIVTVFAINKDTRRPTSKLPERILDRVLGIKEA